MSRDMKEGCGNSPLTYKEVLELAYWGASCYQDDFIWLMHQGEDDERRKPTKRKMKQYKDGYDLCERQMTWIKEEIAKYE